MIVYVPGRMPSSSGACYAARYGPYHQPGYYGQQLLLVDPVNGHHHQANGGGYPLPVLGPPSPPASPPSPGLLRHQQQHQLLNNPASNTSLASNTWPRVMPQDEEMMVTNIAGQHHAVVGVQGMVVNGPPSPAHSDSDASNSSLELSSGRRAEQTQQRCRWKNCGKWFASLDDLVHHVQKRHASAGARGLFYCGWEGCQRGERGFNARYKMLVHVRTHTNEKPHCCLQCSKSFSRAENLKIHARSHTGERPYVCPVPGCNKAYSNSSDRFKHTRTHAVDKPYCCKIPGCPKRYTDPSSLRKHVKTYRHYVNNNNDKGQEKSFEEPMQIGNNNSGMVTTSIMDTTPVKSPRSDSDKKDSSLESSTNTTSTSVGSISSDSLKAASSTSFDEQQKLVDWNSSTQPSSSPLSLSLSLSSSKSSYEHEAHTTTATTSSGRYSRGSVYDDYPLASLKQPTPTYPVDMKHYAPASPPDHLMAATPRIGMQSTPIKSEDKAASGVDYRNIESIVNSTPLKKEAGCDIVRNSVIKRAEPHLQSPPPPSGVYPSTMLQQEPATASDATSSSGECCCKHKCCRHADNDKLLEKTKILSDLILKSPFRHLLASVDLQYSLQNIWSGSQQQQPQQPQLVEPSNTCAQDLRAKAAESLPTDMEQDLPLDLTINK